MYLGHFLLDCVTSPLFLLSVMDGCEDWETGTSTGTGTNNKLRTSQNMTNSMLFLERANKLQNKSFLVFLLSVCGSGSSIWFTKASSFNFSEYESSQFSPSSESLRAHEVHLPDFPQHLAVLLYLLLSSPQSSLVWTCPGLFLLSN